MRRLQWSCLLTKQWAYQDSQLIGIAPTSAPLILSVIVVAQIRKKYSHGLVILIPILKGTPDTNAIS